MKPTPPLYPTETKRVFVVDRSGQTLETHRLVAPDGYAGTPLHCPCGVTYVYDVLTDEPERCPTCGAWSIAF